MAATFWLQVFLGVLAVLLMAQFIHVESLRFFLRLLRLPNAKTVRLHLAVVLSNVAGLGWLLLFSLAPLSFFLVQSGPGRTYYGGRDEMYFLLSQLPGGWMVLIMFTGYVLGFALAIRHLVYPEIPCYLTRPSDAGPKTIPGSEGDSARPAKDLYWSQFAFISFASTGVAIFCAALFGLFLAALMTMAVALGR